MHVLAAFGPADESTAVIYIVAVVCFALAAFGGYGGRAKGYSIGLIGLGLGLWLFPLMWNTADAAFS
jgi:VIT1/CCC1 family predicted Fe2+/Mn2+ transporter